VTPEDAARLVEAGSVTVLDVRSPEEYASLGHIPGSLLLPMELLVCAPALLGPETPVLVCCEHGVRSRSAASFLSEAGLPGVLDLAGGMSCWSGPREWGDGPIAGPSPWLLQHLREFPRRGAALDVACGRGRHALLLSAMGLEVTALDRDAGAIGALAGVASRLGLPLEARVVDLEAEGFALPEDAHDIVVVCRYLHRPLVPGLVRTLRPGGMLLYETFRRSPPGRPVPMNPAFLLGEDELPSLFGTLEILDYRDPTSEAEAGILARRPG
jgi:rhodanese-related sulfurtransferase